MIPMAEIVLAPGGILGWALVGLIAGWLAGVVMKGSGYGILGDLLMGLVGAMLGGFLFSLLVEGVVGFWGSIVVAFFGACLFIAILRALAPGRTV